MRSFEMVRQMHRHRDHGHGREWLALSIHDLDGVLQVGDTDLVDGDATRVARLLNVGKMLGLFSNGHWDQAVYSAQEVAVSQTRTDTRRTLDRKG